MYGQRSGDRSPNGKRRGRGAPAESGRGDTRGSPSKGPVDPGEVAATDAYDLDAEWAVRAAAMPYHGDEQATAGSVRDATRNSLETADDRGGKSLVLPAVGCGVAGFDLRESVRIICEEIDEFESDSLDDVRFVADVDDGHETVRAVADGTLSE